jgi:hypothetical protein
LLDCITASDCPELAVCLRTGFDYGTCSAPGTRETGAQCNESRQCASGYCFNTERCADACLASTDCEAGALCHLPGADEADDHPICTSEATACEPACAETEFCEEGAEPSCESL